MDDFFIWIANELSSIWDNIVNKVMEGFAYLLNLVPVPDFLLNMPSYTISPGITFFASAFEIPFGLSLIFSAYAARFLLRRIPGIG